MMTSAKLAIDIGGTKIFLALCADKSPYPLLFSTAIETPKGLVPLKEALSSVISQALSEAQYKNLTLIPQAFIATPGKLIGKKNNLISPGSAQNMEAFDGEFDHLDLTKAFEPLFPSHWRLSFVNDAIAQMKGGLFQLKQTQIIPSGKWAYIGPGTGLGGGFCTLDQQGTVSIYTDGHIYDIALTTPQNTWVRAEDVLSGRAFFEQTGFTAKEISTSKTQLAQWTSVILQMGSYLAQLIEKLYRGDVSKIPSANAWTPQDLIKVSGTTHFLIGGSLGTQDPFASLLLTQAQAVLKKKPIPSITLHRVPHPSKAALVGCLSSPIETVWE